VKLSLPLKPARARYAKLDAPLTLSEPLDGRAAILTPVNYKPVVVNDRSHVPSPETTAE